MSNYHETPEAALELIEAELDLRIIERSRLKNIGRDDDRGVDDLVHLRFLNARIKFLSSQLQAAREKAANAKALADWERRTRP